jgi:hypothetical protein
MRPIKVSLALIGVIWSATQGYGQQSLYQDASGGTSIYLSNQEGVASFNFGNSKAQVGYSRSVTENDDWRLGLDVYATGQNGFASIIKNGLPQTGVGGDIVLTWTPSLQDTGSLPEPNRPGLSNILCTLCGYWVPINFTYQRSNFDAITSTVQPLRPPQNHNFDSYALRVGINALAKSKSSDFLLGMVVGVERRNNTDTLKTATISTDFVQALQNAQELTLSQNSKAVYVGPYVKYIAVPINVDVIWYPLTNRLTTPTTRNPQPNASKNHFAIDFFERSNVGQTARYIAPGIGLFITKAGQPARPIGGVTASYKEGKAQLALVTGWTF